MTDEQRDAHLRAALRHAPDAQLQPPPALSALILKEARAKARDASVPVRAPRHPLLGMWDWLARPSVAAGFAGVMVATLVGLMWWDQPMDEAMPRPPAPAAAPAAAPAPAPVAATPPAAPTAEATRPAPATEPARALQRKSAPAAKPAPAAAPTPEVAAREEPAAPAAVGAAQPARDAAPPVALSAPPPAPAPAPAAAADTATAGAVATPRAKSLDESKRQRGMASADTLNKAAKNEAREAEVRSSIAAVRTAIAAEPARWAWQRSGSAAAQGMNDAVYAWLAQLESATGPRWQPRAERDTAAPLGRELLLLRDGRVQHSLRVSEGGVWWQSGPNAWHAELTAAQLAALQTALEQAAP